MKKCLIIEKNEETIEQLRGFIEENDTIIFSGKADDYENGLDFVLKIKPDIIFLDLDGTIEDVKGFLLEILQFSEKESVIIALSGSEEKAYFAYQHNFFDYLLKPVSSLSARKCLLKYTRQHVRPKTGMICLKSNKDFNYLNTKDILFLKADNNTTDIYLDDGTVVHAYNTLKIFENELPGNFLRIHKSYIVNSNYVSRIHYGKSLCVIKRTSFKIPFTKTFIENVNGIKDSFSSKSILTLN